MEADGYWLLESDGGLEMGGFGVSARLRDVGRFGQLVLEDGEAFSGRRVLPPGWRDLAGQPDSAPTAFGRLMPGSPCGYGYQWWALPHVPTGIHAGAFLAIGAFGQYIYVHPAAQVVAVIQSAWRQHDDSDADARDLRAAPSCSARAPTGPGVVGLGALPAPVGPMAAQSVPECPCWPFAPVDRTTATFGLPPATDIVIADRQVCFVPTAAPPPRPRKLQVFAQNK